MTAVARSRSPALARASPVRAALGGAVVVSAATALAGVLAYAFQVLAARTLGPAAFGQVGALWGATFLLGIVLFRPLEQTTSRALADRLARGEEVRTVLRAVSRVGVAVAAAFAVAAVLLGPFAARRLFLGDRTMTLLLALAVLGYGVQYVLRGILAGAQWFPGYAGVLLGDGVLRLVLALPLVLVSSRLLAAGAVAAAGGGAAIAVAALCRNRLRSLGRAGRGPAFEARAALAFAAPAAVIAGVDQLLVNGAPLLVLAAGGHDASRAAGVVFAATMLVRIPVFVFQGLSATLLPNVAHLNALRRRGPSAAALQTAGACFATAAVALVGTTVLAGPQALRLIFGAGFSARPGGLALLALGVSFYLPAAALSQALLALDRAGRAALAWAAAGAAFVAGFASVPGDAVLRSGAALASGSGVCLGVLIVVARQRRQAA